MAEANRKKVEEKAERERYQLLICNKFSIINVTKYLDIVESFVTLRFRITLFFNSMEHSYDRQKEQEMQSYHPFGRAGGGAPLKDQAGNVYSMRFNLKLFRYINS